MVNYFLSEEQQMNVDVARQITAEKIIPQRVELDEKEQFPTEILHAIAQADLFGLYVPEEYGGFGGGSFDMVLALEEFARGCVGVATSFAASALGAYPILISGSEELKQKYMPVIASGEKLAAIGLNEANTGRDDSSLHPTQLLERDESVLSATRLDTTSTG